MGYNEFKSKVIQEFLKYGGTKENIPKVKAALDKAVLMLNVESHDKSFLTRAFFKSKGIKISLCKDDVQCLYDEKKEELFVTLILPRKVLEFRNLRQKFSKDESISLYVEHVMELLLQYMYRCKQANIVGAISLSYGVATDFRYGNLEVGFIPPIINNSPVKCNGGRKQREFEKDLEIINCFDPFVNRIIFYYVRSIQLENKFFMEESITALDNCIDLISQSIKERRKILTDKREDLLGPVERELRLSKANCNNLRKLYLLRCRFFAHPAQTKWWDFSEIYHDDFEELRDCVKVVIVKYLQYEKMNRTIVPPSNNWYDWIQSYSDKAFDVSWFHKLPAI